MAGVGVRDGLSIVAYAILISVVFGVILARAASAAPVSATDLQIISSGSRQLSGISNGTVLAQGGNVTEININALSITRTWQGYYGNITGNIHLDDANNNTFYVWGNGTSLSGQIYATRNDSPSWVTVNCTNSVQRSLEEAYLGVSSMDGDSVTNTYSVHSHPSFNVGLVPITANSCYSTNVFVNGSAQNSTFHQVLLSDVTNNTIYTTMIAYHTAGFNGKLVDFQLMVGENEHPGNIGPTSYYFFVELN